MKTLTGGGLVVECLRRHGVRQVFSIAGGQMGTIYDSIGKSEDISLFTPRNETVVPVMAAGYVASSGEPCVSMTTVGAGVVYEVAGLLTSWLDYIPVISIAPQVQSYKMKPHQESLQACNQDELFEPVTKWNSIIYHWDRIPQIVDRGFREALSGAPGPVHLDIPVDVLFKRKVISRESEKKLLPDCWKTRYSGPIKPDEEKLRDALKALQGAKKPVAIVGQGMNRRDRYPGLGKWLGELGIPALTTKTCSAAMPCAGDCYAGDESLYSSSPAGLEVLKAADLLLVIGIDRYSRKVLNAVRSGTRVVNMIQIETDPAAFIVTGNNRRAYSDPVCALSFFSNEMNNSKRKFNSWRKEFASIGETIAGAAYEKNQAVKALADKFAVEITREDIVISDGETARKLAIVAGRRFMCGQLFIMDEEDMPGNGLPFAIGALIANPGSRIILICDSRALMYNVRELQPAASAGLELNIICIDRMGWEGSVCDIAPVLKGLKCSIAGYNSSELESKEEMLLRNHRGPRAVIIGDGTK